MKACPCKEPHERRRVVLTGGPGAGKTAVLELIRRSFCEHVKVLPEAAGSCSAAASRAATARSSAARPTHAGRPLTHPSGWPNFCDAGLPYSAP